MLICVVWTEEAILCLAEACRNEKCRDSEASSFAEREVKVEAALDAYSTSEIAYEMGASGTTSRRCRGCAWQGLRCHLPFSSFGTGSSGTETSKNIIFLQLLQEIKKNNNNLLSRN